MSSNFDEARAEVQRLMLSLQLKIFFQCCLELIDVKEQEKNCAENGDGNILLDSRLCDPEEGSFLSSISADLLCARCVELGFHIDIRRLSSFQISVRTFELNADIKATLQSYEFVLNTCITIHSSLQLSDLLINPLVLRIKESLRSCLPTCPGDLDSIAVEFTGGEDGYVGDFMMEYEINPAAGGHKIYWPDVSKFSPAHVNRFTLGNPDILLDVTVFGILTDLPHEVGHILQQFYCHKIDPNIDDGWLAEHDPSVISLNLLLHALSHIKDDGLNVPGLFESVYLWLNTRVLKYREKISAADIAAYVDWKQSCGYVFPEAVQHASVASDYLKMRAAIEGYSIDIKEQLTHLFENRDKNIRSAERPPLDICHSHTIIDDV